MDRKFVRTDTLRSFACKPGDALYGQHVAWYCKKKKNWYNIGKIYCIGRKQWRAETRITKATEEFEWPEEAAKWLLQQNQVSDFPTRVPGPKSSTPRKS